MPVGLGRRHLGLVADQAEGKYMASEKTDGVRYLLVVTGGTATLIDRTLAHFVCAGLRPLASVLPEGAVLDGELVIHRTLGRHIFMAFDLLSDGRRVRDDARWHVVKRCCRVSFRHERCSAGSSTAFLPNEPKDDARPQLNVAGWRPLVERSLFLFGRTLCRPHDHACCRCVCRDAGG